MEIEKARTRLNDLRISEVPTNAVQSTTEKEEEDSTEVVVPTRLEEAGRKYCCATCYRSYGRVTHVALEKKVTLEPIFFVSGGKGREKNLCYTNRNPRINSHSVEAGRINLPGLIRKFNTVCNFCGEIVGWHLTAKTDKYPTEAYWCDTLMDR
ncbi:hypothetical protein MKW92_024635 [Papaver armeniacum]|nr:hypothetical protein MKW92_024635 [Papaver armeniacum]